MKGRARIRRGVVAAACALVSSIEAHAQVLVSAYGGAVHTRPAKVAVEQPAETTSLTFPDVPFRSESLEFPIYYGYRVAGRIPRTQLLFLEAELIHAKVFAQSAEAAPGSGRRRGGDVTGVPFTSVFDQFGISHGMNFVLVNALLRKPIGSDGRWIATARAGAGAMVPHPEIVIAGEGDDEDDSYQLGGAGAQVGAGLERAITRRLSASAEYKFTYSRLDLSVAAATVRLTTRSHHLAVGLGFTFN